MPDPALRTTRIKGADCILAWDTNSVHHDSPRVPDAGFTGASITHVGPAASVNADRATGRVALFAVRPPVTEGPE